MCGGNPLKEMLATCLYCWSEPERQRRTQQLVWILWSMAVSTQMACKLRIWALRLHFVKYSSYPPLEAVFLFALSVLSPVWIALVSVHVPIYNCFFVYYIVGSQIYCKFSSKNTEIEYHNKAESNTIFLFLNCT